MELFDNIWKLVGVPVITVQLRYDGWVTEMQVRQFLPESGFGWLMFRMLPLISPQSTYASVPSMITRNVCHAIVSTGNRRNPLPGNLVSVSTRGAPPGLSMAPAVVTCQPSAGCRRGCRGGPSGTATRRTARRSGWTTCCTAPMPTSPASRTSRSPAPCVPAATRIDTRPLPGTQLACAQFERR